jgi:hypothetical protein
MSIGNTCNIPLKHLKTYACNIIRGRECEVQPEKPTPDLMMSRAEVEHRGDANVDSGHDFLVGNGRVGSTYRDRAQICGEKLMGL